MVSHYKEEIRKSELVLYEGLSEEQKVKVHKLFNSEILKEGPLW